jgi:hypothetical protein
MANALRVGDHLLERLGVRRAADAETNGKFQRSDTQTVQPHTTDPQEATR